MVGAVCLEALCQPFAFVHPVHSFVTFRHSSDERVTHDRNKERRSVDLGELLPRRLGGGAHLRMDLPQALSGSKDYEALCTTGEPLVYVAMARLMARRLARV